MNEYSSEDLYMIRVRENEEGVQAIRLSKLEEKLAANQQVKIKYVVQPISAVFAYLYDKELVDYLAEEYEVIPQEKTMHAIEDTN